jgi:hypothetical protein
MITDNSENQRQIDWLAAQDAERLLVASGYFEPRIWRNPRTSDGIADSLKNLKEFKLLLGSKPSSDVGQAGLDHLDISERVSVEAKEVAQRFLDGQGVSIDDIDTLQVLNRLEFNKEHQALVKQLVFWLEGGTGTDVQIRYWASDFLHAKLILAFDENGNGAASVGSSNFTPAGLGFSKKNGDKVTGNRELNLISVDETTIKELNVWFDEHWDAMSDVGGLDAETKPITVDWKPRLIELLKESKFGDKRHDPHHVFLKILYEYFETRYGPEGALQDIAVSLSGLQKQSFRQAIHNLERFNGVIIADAVGLGKTYTGLAILDHYLGQRRPGHNPRALIICPAQLLTMWKTKTKLLNINVHDFESMEKLGRMDYADSEDDEEEIDVEFHELLDKFGEHDIILVDEGHNFRNMHTKRYQNLMKLMQGGNPDKKLVMLTATPINTDVNDLKHQILLLARGHPQYYRSVGITNLESFFRRYTDQSAETPADIYQLLEHVLVRHSRLDVVRDKERGKTHYIENSVGERIPITFPDRQLFRIDYDLAGVYGGLDIFERLKHLLSSLKHAPYNMEDYLELDEEEKKKRRGSLSVLMTVMLLKRLESSSFAFEKTVSWFQTYLEFFRGMVLEKGKVMKSSAFRRFQNAIAALGHDSEESAQIIALEAAEAIITDLFGTEHDGFIDLEPGLNQTTFSAAVDHDLAIYSEVLGIVEDARNTWQNAVMDGTQKDFDIGRDSPLKTAIENGLVTDLKVESFKSAYLNGLGAEDERLVTMQIPTKEGTESKTVRYPARPQLPPLKNNANGKNIIFCYYRDTAQFLYEAIINDDDFLNSAGIKKEEVAILHGGSPKGPSDPFSTTTYDGISRHEVLWRFSPNSNIDVDTPGKKKRKEKWNTYPVKLLISTDVLSEGQNLQDSQGLINFDLHWNPVRMVQRVGRIDRLFSAHDKLYIANVFPDTALEGLMNLVGRIMERSKTIDKIIGMDGSVLGEELSGKTYQEHQRLLACDDDVLDELERIADFASIDEMRFPLMDFLADEGEGARGVLSKMQFGVHSRALGLHRVSRNAKDKGVFLSFKIGKDNDIAQQHEWLWWPASTIPAMSDKNIINDSLALLNLENEGWTKEQESELDSIWKPVGSPITSKTNIFSDINIAKTDEVIWSEEWGNDELKHWIWPIVEESIRYIIRERTEIIQKDKIARKQKTGLNKSLAPIIRNYQNITSQRRRADPVRVKRISQLIDDNRIPSSKPYTNLVKQFSEMEKMHEGDSDANAEPDFGWFIHELDKLLERDRIYAAAKIIRSVEAIRRENLQLVAYLVVN